MHFRNQFGCSINYGGHFPALCLEKQVSVLPSPTLETGREMHMRQTAHPENKIIPVCLNLLMENLESCWNHNGKRLHFPQVKGTFLIKSGNPRRVTTLCGGKHQYHQYRESKLKSPISNDLWSIFFSEFFLTFIFPFSHIICIKIHHSIFSVTIYGSSHQSYSQHHYPLWLASGALLS